jgi:hypothetical protein
MHLHAWIISQLSSINMKISAAPVAITPRDPFRLFTTAANSTTTRLVILYAETRMVKDKDGMVDKSVWDSWIFALSHPKRLHTLKIQRQMPNHILSTAGVVATFWPTLTTLEIRAVRLEELQAVLPLAPNLKKLKLLGNHHRLAEYQAFEDARKLMQVIATHLPNLECLVLQGMGPSLSVIRQLTRLSRLECMEESYQEDGELKQSWRKKISALADAATSADDIQRGVESLFAEISSHIPSHLIYWDQLPHYMMLSRIHRVGSFGVDYVRAVCKSQFSRSQPNSGLIGRLACDMLENVARFAPAALADVIQLLTTHRSTIRALLDFVDNSLSFREINENETTLVETDAIFDSFRSWLVPAISKCASVDEPTAMATVFGERGALGLLLDILGLSGVRSMMASEEGQRVLQEKYGIHDIRNYNHALLCSIWDYCKTEGDVDFLLSLNIPLHGMLDSSKLAQMPRNVRIKIFNDARLISPTHVSENLFYPDPNVLDALVDYFQAVVKCFGLHYANREWLHPMNVEDVEYWVPLAYIVVQHLRLHSPPQSSLQWIRDLHAAGFDMDGGPFPRFDPSCNSVR